MILWLVAAVVAALGAAALLLAHVGARYARRAEARWPALGRTITVDGAPIHIAETGPADAPRVLLIHGASANLRELWGPLAEPLAANHRVIAYDRPGYGHSPPRRGAHKLEVQARIAAGVLEATGGGAIVVAHSLGAATALRLAHAQPQLVRGLVLIAPASHPYPGDNAWWARISATPVLGDLFCGAVIPWVGPLASRGGVANNFHPGAAPVNYYDDAGVGLIFRASAFRASAIDVCATKSEFAAQAPLYGDILTPAIIVTGETDRVVSPRLHARALAREMPAAELVTAPDVGHMPHRLRPDLVLAAIHRVEAMAETLADG